MINIIADTHTHTLACDHAYSTLMENIAAAKKKGLRAIAMTEHSPSMPGAPSWLHFTGLSNLPDEIDGITIIKGAEVNIMDYDGALDLKNNILKKLDWIIASMHATNLQPSDRSNHAKGWIAVAKNPLVDVIGHCGDARYEFDYKTVLKSFKEYDKIIEINSHSFSARPGSTKNCAEIAKLCKEYEISVVVSSDSHYAGNIGNFTKALTMLEEIDFPARLILNSDADVFFNMVESRKQYR